MINEFDKKTNVLSTISQVIIFVVLACHPAFRAIMKRLCLVCLSPLDGRADKKFCDDQCRSSFNNTLKTQELSYLKEINQILRKNRAILKARNPDGGTRYKKELLIRKGFNFSFHTHSFVTKNGTPCFFCYEYGYVVLEDVDVLLLKSEEC